ncbi:MAG: SDR family oxidoreductase [Gemmatimonadetes bacterium]|uniref:SDR family oxidoreductase n=1 Tax=Candidatus Kutchimonas denitrificans TaxID=3056748 RepID=A0AAE4Z9J0_9BACT|nr:SDR family oxidoreductase [Gemmatimonadota bacterium]NIR73991.1 SDR family oxidoreductase [Candidatus Kutchimonas denitrificans]NIS02980.1 SDR family oxidoreductase [Gemmatimonadota bacterium]NIT68697.1 SDR family oxidoreductase [Gemmatimonadota bacterium]NIU53278.1 SDR family oxidoreductase [Gemmatimonadota bacterium]
MPNLDGKVAIVTGGSKGIGLGIAAALADAGASVVLCSRDESEARSAADDIASNGGRAMGLGVDVRKHDDVKRLITAATDEFGGLDILVANAGVGGFGPIDELEPDEWRRVIDTNLTGVYYCCHEAVPALKKRGGGWIITIGSLAGRNTFAGGTAYNASKFGLLGFTEALMLDVRHDDIRVSCVMPGSVDTHFDGSKPGSDSWKLTPDDVAKVVLQLLDHDARSLPSKVEIRPSRPKKR